MSKHINLSGLKTLLEPLVHLINKKAERPDWNENDPSSPDYIENRTHWESVEETQLLQATINDTYVEGLPFTSDLKEGQTYTVTWDSVEYRCPTYHDSYGNICIGNQSIGIEFDWEFLGIIQSNEPFFICMAPDGYNAVMCKSGNHTVEISGMVTTVHKIDEKYLPKLVGMTGNAPGAEIFNSYETNSANGVYSHVEGKSNTANGDSSHAEGYSTYAGANYSHAEGYDTDALGRQSHAEGYDTKTSGSASHAEGAGTEAQGDYSHAEGFNTIAAGSAQHVEGKYNISNSNLLHIAGNGTSSKRSNAHTLDWSGNAWFAGDIYVGGTSQSSGAAKIATNIKNGENSSLYTLGASSEQLGQYAFAQGEKTLASGQGSFSSGKANIAAGDFSHTEGAGVGRTVPLSGEINATQYLVSNLYIDRHYVSIGYCCLTDYGEIATVTAVEPASITFNKTLSKTQALTAKDIFLVNQYALGTYSHAEGYSTKAQGNYSHAEGCSTEAQDNYSHAEGYCTKAQSYSSHAEGYETIASGDCSHAEGSKTEAKGDQSHAEGFSTIASGNFSHAEGFWTTASGDCSHAEGSHTIAATMSENVIGEFNLDDGVIYVPSGQMVTLPKSQLNNGGEIYRFLGVEFDKYTGTHLFTSYESVQASNLNPGDYFGYSTNEVSYRVDFVTSSDISYTRFIKSNPGDERGKYVHIAGNGTATNNRSNAHTLDWDGNAWYAGDVYVGSTSGKNKDEGSKKLATESYVEIKVSELVNSAPETLNTLNELATALGNDPNFATTISSQIGSKASSSDLTSHTGNKSNPHDVTAAQINAVPTSRTVNGKALTADITLSASDINAAESSHNQAASTITAGTFAGAVVAQASSQTPATSLLRNSKLVPEETDPVNNGEICWIYE